MLAKHESHHALIDLNWNADHFMTICKYILL